MIFSLLALGVKMKSWECKKNLAGEVQVKNVNGGPIVVD